MLLTGHTEQKNNGMSFLYLNDAGSKSGVNFCVHAVWDTGKLTTRSKVDTRGETCRAQTHVRNASRRSGLHSHIRWVECKVVGAKGEGNKRTGFHRIF